MEKINVQATMQIDTDIKHMTVIRVAHVLGNIIFGSSIYEYMPLGEGGAREILLDAERKARTGVEEVINKYGYTFEVEEDDK